MTKSIYTLPFLLATLTACDGGSVDPDGNDPGNTLNGTWQSCTRLPENGVTSLVTAVYDNGSIKEFWESYDNENCEGSASPALTASVYTGTYTIGQERILNDGTSVYDIDYAFESFDSTSGSPETIQCYSIFIRDGDILYLGKLVNEGEGNDCLSVDKRHDEIDYISFYQKLF